MPRVKSPPWHMNCEITRWKAEPLKCRGLPLPPMPFSPVHRARKFCGAEKRGAQSGNSSLALALSVSWQQSAHGSACTGRGWGGRDTECVIKRESWEGAQIRAAHLRGLGHDVRTKRHLDAAGRRAADGHVEVDDRSAHGC